MKKYILLILSVFLFIFLVKIPPVSALTQEDCAKFLSTSFPPSSECMKVPCSNAYKWVLIPPGTNVAPQVDASKYGYTNGTAANACAVKSDCPQNTTDEANVNKADSNWCYQFADGTRCIQIQHIPGETCPGGDGGGGSGTCDIGGQTPDMGADCAACLSTKTSPTNVPAVITNIKNMNPNDFSACNNQEILNNWCNAFGATAAQQCTELKTGVCASACGGGSPTPVRRDLCVSTNVSPDNISTGGQLTITSTSNEASLRNFRYAFYNRDNSTKIICQQGIPSVVDEAERARQCPNGGAPFVIDKPAASDAKTLATTFTFADFDKPDLNWSGKKPTNLQVNGYFIDKFGMSSLANVNCSKGFTVTQEISPPSPPPPSPPPPSPAAPAVFTTDYRIAEDPADFSDDPNSPNGWKEYKTEPITIDNFEFKSKDPGLKFIWVEFKDTTGKIERRSAQIKILGPDPKVTDCSLAFEGSNTILNIKGENFGSAKGVLTSVGTNLQIRAWNNSSIQAVLANAPTGQIIPVSLTNVDGQISEATCGAIAQLALGAKVFCRAPSRFDTDNVDLTLADASKVLVKQKVKIDKDGIVQGLTQKLEEGKNYTLSLKAPKGIRQTVSFTAGGGITNIPGFILPIGDIFPIDGGDGSINVLDKAELNRQWNIASNVSGRSGDFNQDTRVNSIDWACMRYDFGKKDDLEAAPGVQLSPSPSPSARPMPCAPGVVAGTAGCVIPSPSPSPI